MEHLFSPCTRYRYRYRDLVENEYHLEEALDDFEGLQELNLDVSTEELLSAERAFTYADLYAMLGNQNTVAWLTPHAFVVPTDGREGLSWRQLTESCRFCFNADGKQLVAFARSLEHLLEICDVVLRLLAASVVHSAILRKPTSRDGALRNAPSINAATLAYLMEQCQSLKVLSLRNLVMDENHCRVFGAYSRPGLEIVLSLCRLNSAGASALAEVFGRNQGPTKLFYCDIDSFILVDRLRGNSRLKSFTSSFSGDFNVGNRQVLAIAGALKENKGLVELDLCGGYSVMRNKTWGAICDSLKTHPTLKVLDLIATYDGAPLAPTVVKFWVQALLDMMKMNTSIHTMRLHDRYIQHGNFRRSVIPYLETNRFRSPDYVPYQGGGTSASVSSY
jgi:hypothetical protein